MNHDKSGKSNSTRGRQLSLFLAAGRVHDGEPHAGERPIATVASIGGAREDYLAIKHRHVDLHIVNLERRDFE
jgi:hypothetical protein